MGAANASVAAEVGENDGLVLFAATARDPPEHILQGSGSDFALGTKFRWKTFRVTITSTVQEFIPHERIKWGARAIGLEVYHAWVLQPTSQGCHVLTEETQHGWLARLGRVVMPNRVHRYRQIWFESLARQSAVGLPSRV